MSYFQCNLCWTLLPTKFGVWSHLLRTHGVPSTSEVHQEDKPWRILFLPTLQLILQHLTNQEIALYVTRLPPKPPPPLPLGVKPLLSLGEEPPHPLLSTQKDEKAAAIHVSVDDTSSPSVWRYSCSPCALSFRLHTALRRHRWEVHGETPEDLTSYACDHPGCKKAFRVLTLLEYHKLGHAADWEGLTEEEQKRRKMEVRKVVMETRSFTCPTCGMKFDYETTFRKHCRSHETKKHYTCPTCCSSYRQPYSLQAHLREEKCSKVLQLRKDRSFSCHLCGTCLKSEKGLRAHRRDRHGIRIPRAILRPCNLCDFVAATLGELANHQKTHTKEQGWMCEACGVRFTARPNLRRHIRRNCVAARERGLHLILEEQAVTNKAVKEAQLKPKRFPCPECGSSFSNITMLHTHLRRHGDRWKCEDCPASFLNRKMLLYHKGVVHKMGKQPEGVDPMPGVKVSAEEGLIKDEADDEEEEELLDDSAKSPPPPPPRSKFHPPPRVEAFPCPHPFCKESFQTLKMLGYHSLTHSPDWDGCSKEEKMTRELAVMQSFSVVPTTPGSTTTTCVSASDALPAPSFRCDLCSRCFGSEHGLGSHHRKKHPGNPLSLKRTPRMREKKKKEKEVHVCGSCGLTLAKLWNLKRHISRCPVTKKTKVTKKEAKEKAGRRTKVFRCPECGQGFSKRTAVAQHLVKHGGRWKCGLCSAVFCKRTALISHRAGVHKGEGKREVPLNGGDGDGDEH